MLRSFLLTVGLLLASNAMAEDINLRNANFYIDQEDFAVQKPGAALELIRVYNSRSTEDGLFGYGWSTHFDTMVKVHADGTVLVVDYDGFILRYTHEGRPWAEITAEFVDRLIAARRLDDQAHGGLREESHYDHLRELWLADGNEREQATWLYPKAWVEPPDGTYYSAYRGSEKLTKRGGVYERVRADGLIEAFDDEGRMVRRQDSSGHGLRFDYDRETRLYKVSHTDGANFTIIYGNNKKVSEVRDTEGRIIAYAYDKDGNLLQVKGPGKRVVAYAYDTLHNMVAVRQPDGSGLQVLYDTEKDWAVALKRGEEVTRYEWTMLNDSGTHYLCTVTGPTGSQTRHEYDDEARSLVVTDEEGEQTRTRYSSCCEKPVEVEHPDGSTTRYDYDDRGRLVGAARPDGVRARYEYDGDQNYIVRASFSDGRRYVYSYDDGGRIIRVESVGSRWLDLQYGPNGKVDIVVSSNGDRYTFAYDADGRPVQITGREGVALKLTYDVAGSIASSEVTTPSESMKAEFYRDLQEVLEMLEPATGSF